MTSNIQRFGRNEYLYSQTKLCIEEKTHLLFGRYGFWMQCFNDYRRVRPHEGYDIIRRWARDKNFRGGEVESTVAKNVRTLTRLLEQDEETPTSKIDELDEPYYVSPTERAGAFYFFTSNVDAHCKCRLQRLICIFTHSIVVLRSL